MRKVLLVFIFPFVVLATSFDIMPGVGIVKGSEVLDTHLFNIKLSSGADYGIRAQLSTTLLGLEAYYVVNSLETNAIDKIRHLDLDFSDKFVNYGVGVFLHGSGLIAPYLSLTYGKTKFTGTHRYAPDGKHFTVGLGAKVMLSSIGLWGEARVLRVMDILEEYEEFADPGKFTTFSVNVGAVLRFK